MGKFNTNQKIVISTITAPILAYLFVGFLKADFNITKWSLGFRLISLPLIAFAYVCTFAYLHTFEKKRNKDGR